ncbi:hypothetical protein VSR01_16640 [Actinacidiphila sp. DG2A-62]|uniref:hypothetical protein n=1 Tax=Actinacidiphila sp. DG2A-62 TaxID=3108821 RepID=UPI002DB64462|nr:hypothetical protein [Actinacidiphila sp. DG2A-62]MEC3995075.1 hypothetical protein [Actinacidiphila sp. DG2A-62]
MDPKGTVWHRSDTDRAGEPVYYIDGAPASCPSWVMSTRAELEATFGAPMRPVGGEDQ